MDNSPKGVLKALESRFPWITNLISEKTLLWILGIFLIFAGFFKDIPSGSVAVMVLGIILITYALIDPKTIKKLSSKYLSFERYEYNKEERQTAVQAGQKEIPPEVKLKLDQIAADARKRMDEERAPEDYLVLADEARRRKKFEDGLGLAYVGLNLDPKNQRTQAGLFNIIGLIYDDRHFYPLAEENFRKAVQTDDKFLLAYGNLGNIYSKQKKYGEAETEYRKALALDPNYVHTHSNLGLLYFVQKKYAEAETEYRKALALDPNFAPVHSHLGSLYLDQKKYVEAEAEYRKALVLDPNYEPALNNLGYLCLKSNRFSEAEDYIKKAVALDSTIPVFHDSLGELYMEQGKLDEAEASFKKSLELDPDYKEAQENLEKLRKLRGGDED